jgi:predicted TIM-barrel fold metal-dependent hydrolase
MQVIPVNEIHTTPLASVMDSFPDLTMVAAHLGGHRCWDDVEQYLLGRNIYFDTAYVFPVPGSEHITVERIREIMETHGFDKDQGLENMNIMKMDIEEKHKEMILDGNAERLFKIDSGDEC